jgi:hypothetical protein
MARRKREFPILVGILWISIFTACFPAVARQGACTSIEFTVGVILPDGRVVRGLKRDDVVAHVRKQTMEIQSIQYDTGPRRILFIVDNGRDMSPEAKKAEVEVVQYILFEGRPEDSFGLITARGPHQEVKFGEAREKIAAELEKAMTAANERGRQPGVLDAMTVGIGWFGPSRPGDSIFAMASEVEADESAAYRDVAAALAQNRIRLFSFRLGIRTIRTYFSTMSSDPSSHLTSSTKFIANEESLDALTWNSGGYLVVEEMKNPKKEYKLTSDHVKELQNEGSRMYRAAVEVYRVHAKPPGKLTKSIEWQLDLSEPIRKLVPHAKLLYPRLLQSCI